MTAIAGATGCAREPEPSVPNLTVEIAAQPPQPIATGPVASAAPLPFPLAAPSVEASTPPPVAEERKGLIDDYDPSGKHRCAELRCPPAHPFHEGFVTLMHDCRGLERGLKPEPFQRFIQCMLRQNNTRATCDLLLVNTDPGGCLERWTKPDLPDPLTASVCAPIVQRCAARSPPPSRPVPWAPSVRPPPPRRPPLSQGACQGLLTVTTDRVRPKMIACMTEYCDEAPTLCYISLSN